MKTRIKTFIITAVAATALAVPAAASAGGAPMGSPNDSCNSGHGTCGYIGALGENGSRHDLGQGDTTLPGSLKLGADGPATGAGNSAASQACKA